jgi:PAS domain S-box-containing protein
MEVPLNETEEAGWRRHRPKRRRLLGWDIDPLTMRMAAGIAILVVVPLGLGFHALSSHHYEQTVATQRRAAEVQGRILETALLHQMMEEDTTLMRTILEEIGTQPSVRSAMILNHEGEIRIASDAELVGQVVPQDSPSCIVCHDEDAEARERWTTYGEGDEELLRTVLPIENRPRCHRCHPADTPINGILILDTSLEELKSELRADTSLFIGGAIAVGLLVVGGIGLFVRRLVLNRLGRLGGTARAISAGNLNERAVTKGGDVISWLAADFNHMADTVSELVAEVREQEAQLLSIMDSLDDGLVVLDAESRVVAANRAFCRRLGSSPETIRGRRCSDSIGAGLPCCTDRGDCPAARCRTSGTMQRAVYSISSDGAEGRTVEEVHASPVFDKDGRIVQVVEIWRDISERVEEEERLAEIEHLVALGTLASGFSHEVNTPLASMLTCAESAIDQIDGLGANGDSQAKTLPAIRECATIIRDQVLRCRKITEQFLRFSRGIPPSIEPLELRQVVRASVSLVQGTAQELRVAIEVRGEDPLPPVRANQEVVQHVLLNLMVNALDSCEDRGGKILLDFDVEDRFVRVRLKDDGCGIDAETRSHLFQPFQTRKRGGTGLGLFLSRSFMQRFGGDVRLLHSTPGGGSCFEVSFERIEVAEA